LEKWVIKQSFYTGSNEEYISKLRYGKKEKLNYLRISSEIKDYSPVYILWFDFITQNGLKLTSDKIEVDCTKLCDERGYVNNELVTEQFKTILDDQLKHIN
jgi:hypothetical protein